MAGTRPLLAVQEVCCGERQQLLVVDLARRRVARRALGADVDLSSLAVSYHEPARRVSLLGRLREWLDPVAYAKAVSGPTRSAVWLGGGLLAVAGSDGDASPAGLTTIDTRTWSVRTIDRDATGVRVAGRLLLATGESGLTAYGLAGDTRFRRFDGREAWIEQVYGGRAYVDVARPGLAGASRLVVDLRTGRVGRARELPRLLLAAASSCGTARRRW